MNVTYSSNNSGGGWWLTDENWKALEAAGWNVHWVKDSEFHKDFLDSDDRWLGALATEADKDFPSVHEAIAEWEAVTGLDADSLGCPCCGEPHYFSDYS